MHETSEIVNLVHNNRLIIKKPISFGVQRLAGDFFEFGGADTVVVNELNTIRDLGGELFNNFLPGVRFQFIHIGWLVKIGDPDGGRLFQEFLRNA